MHTPSLVITENKIKHIAIGLLKQKKSKCDRLVIGYLQGSYQQSNNHNCRKQTWN